MVQIICIIYKIVDHRPSYLFRSIASKMLIGKSNPHHSTLLDLTELFGDFDKEFQPSSPAPNRQILSPMNTIDQSITKVFFSPGHYTGK